MDVQKTPENKKTEVLGYVSLMLEETGQGDAAEPLLACYCNCGCACYVVPS